MAPRHSIVGFPDLLVGVACVGAFAWSWHVVAERPLGKTRKEVAEAEVLYEEPDARTAQEVALETAVPPVPAPPEVAVAQPRAPAAAPQIVYVSAPGVTATNGQRGMAPGDEGLLESESAPPLSSTLPSEEKQVFESLVAQGEALQREGARAPAYRSRDLSDGYVDRLIERGLARVVLKFMGGDQQPILFDGILSRPGKAYYGPTDRRHWIRFSSRAIQLDNERTERFVASFRRTFLSSPSDKAALCVVLLRTELDLAILASQEGAARDCGLELKDVSLTEGRIEKWEDFPLRYVVERLVGTDGRSLEVKSHRDTRKAG